MASTQLLTFDMKQKIVPNVAHTTKALLHIVKVHLANITRHTIYSITAS